MYSQYQHYRQQNPSTTAYSSTQASNWNTTQTTGHSHSNYSSSSHYSSGANNPQPVSNNSNSKLIPGKPVEHYTTYYHGWNSQATELEQQLRMLPANNYEGKKDIQNKLEWAKYYADISSQAAHFFFTRILTQTLLPLIFLQNHPRKPLRFPPQAQTNRTPLHLIKHKRILQVEMLLKK